MQSTEHRVPLAVAEANRNATKHLLYNERPEEFSHLRYSQLFCDADDYTPANGYSLRASDYGRTTDLLIAITCFNESGPFVSRTLDAVMSNVRELVRSSFGAGDSEKGRLLGDRAWERIVVCILSDGMEAIDQGVLDVLTCIGVYQPGLANPTSAGTMHVFEYTTGISPSQHEGDMMPVQFIFGLKRKNAGKLNSHRWLFSGLASHLQPNIVVTVDAGTVPGTRAVEYLWNSFEENEWVGGACGELKVISVPGRGFSSILAAAQKFEYKMGAMLDKPSESAVGHIAVLSGAFSAYRLAAIQGEPLQHYLASDRPGQEEASLLQRNLFLAEDRVLSFELVAQAKARWTVRYVPEAKAETDVPESPAELMLQRRRWLNGTHAAALHSLIYFRRFYSTHHSLGRLALFHIQAFCNVLTLFISWFSAGLLLLSTFVMLDSLQASLNDPLSIPKGSVPTDAAEIALVRCWANSPFLQSASSFQHSALHIEGVSGFFHEHDALSWAVSSVKVAYLGMLASQILYGIGSRPRNERAIYSMSFLFFAAIAVLLLCGGWVSASFTLCSAQDRNWSPSLLSSSAPIMLGILAPFGIHALAALVQLSPGHLFTALPQYWLMAPALVNVLHIYALCNVQDCSWGTKLQCHVRQPSQAEHLSRKVRPECRGEKGWLNVDEALEAARARLAAPSLPLLNKTSTRRDDDDCAFRTRLILGYIGSNAVMVILLYCVDESRRSYGVAACASAPSIERGSSLCRLLGIKSLSQTLKFLGLLCFLVGNAWARLRRHLRAPQVTPSMRRDSLYAVRPDPERRKSH